MNKASDFVFDKRKAYSVLAISTLTFLVSYMVWMMFAIIGLPIKEIWNLDATEFGLLTAVPALTGSLSRAPLGFLVDRFGGRIVMFALLLFSVIPIWLVSCAQSYWQFLVLGIFIGMIGGSYGIGIPYVVHWFPKNRQGLAMSIYGAGSTGATLNNILAPWLITLLAWTLVPQVYAGLVLMVALVFWFLSDKNTAQNIVSKKITLKEQLSSLKDPNVWCYCLYYTVGFGGFAALSFWMVQYYVGEFGLDLKYAALLTACFTFPASIFRILGGWLSDKYGGHQITVWVMRVSFVCLFFLSFPNTDFAVGNYNFYIGLNPYIFTVLMFVLGICFSFCKASVYKYISDNYIQKMGAVSGIVGTIAGVGSSILLVLFGILFDLTGIRSSAFILLLLMVCLSAALLRSAKIR